MNKEILERAYAAIGDLTPMLTDCGAMCEAACCEADEDGQGGVYLFPGEKELLGLMVTQPDWKPADLSGLRVPTLVIAGEKDMIRTSHTKAIHRAIAGSGLAILPGDHFVAHGNPEAFNRAVMDFLMK